MAHLTVPQLIKIILGIFLFVVIIGGAYLFFSGTVLDFFKNLPGGEGEFGGGGASGDIDGEEVREPTFVYDSKTYTARSSTRIERDDGRYYIWEGDIWSYHGPSSEQGGYVTPETEGGPEYYDRWIDLVNNAISVLSEESPGSPGREGEVGDSSVGGDGIQKTYKIDQVGFRIGNNIEFNEEVSTTGAVEFIVISEDNCETIEYQIFRNNNFLSTWKVWQLRNILGIDEKIYDNLNLNNVNGILESLSPGTYHIVAFCFNDEGKSTKIESKNLEIR